MVTVTNYYTRLKVSRDATQDEIRSAYFEAARRLHPDTNESPDASEQFIKVQEAYDVLSNPDKRKIYDDNLDFTEPIEPEASINVIYSQAGLPRLREPQLFYALFRLTSTGDLPVHAVPPLNVCLVLDRSTSMMGTRMDMVKTNAIQILRQIRPEDYFSIVVFSDRAETLIPSGHLVDIPKAESEISLLKTGGGTEIYQGLVQGVNELKKVSRANLINHLILLTDGRTYGDDEACLKLAEDAAYEGISFSTLGIGHEYNDAFLDELASCSGGGSMHISAPKDLHQYLEDKFKGLGRVYAENVTLELQLNEDVELKYAFRLQPELGYLGNEFPLRLGDLQYTKDLTFILEILVKQLPEESDEMQIGSGRITMLIPSRSVPHARFRLAISRPISDEVDVEPPKSSILRAMSTLTLYRLQERARGEVMRGDISSATRHLEFLATNLLSQGEQELAQSVLKEAEHLQNARQYNQEADKKIKYGTRALLLPASSDKVDNETMPEMPTP